MDIDDGVCMCRFLSEGIDAKHVCISTWWAPWLPSPLLWLLAPCCPSLMTLHKLSPANYAASVPALPFSMILGCLSHQMPVTRHDPLFWISSRLFCRPSLHYPPRGRRWMVVCGPGCAVGCRHCWCQNIKCQPGCTGGCHHYLMVPEYQMPGGSHRCCHSPLIDG